MHRGAAGCAFRTGSTALDIMSRATRLLRISGLLRKHVIRGAFAATGAANGLFGATRGRSKSAKSCWARRQGERDVDERLDQARAELAERDSDPWRRVLEHALPADLPP